MVFLCAESTRHHVISLVEAAELPPLVTAAGQIDRSELRRRYDAMRGYEGRQGDEDFEYTWADFEEFAGFLARASDQGRAVVFTVDQ